LQFSSDRSTMIFQENQSRFSIELPRQIARDRRGRDGIMGKYERRALADLEVQAPSLGQAMNRSGPNSFLVYDDCADRKDEGLFAVSECAHRSSTQRDTRRRMCRCEPPLARAEQVVLNENIASHMEESVAQFTVHSIDSFDVHAIDSSQQRVLREIPFHHNRQD